MIDIHCHILPGIDDGARNWEITLEMCRLARQDGITHIVATPHANYDYKYDREAHLALLDELRARMPELRFSLGCDLHLSYENIDAAAKIIGAAEAEKLVDANPGAVVSGRLVDPSYGEAPKR